MIELLKRIELERILAQNTYAQLVAAYPPAATTVNETVLQAMAKVSIKASQIFYANWIEEDAVLSGDRERKVSHEDWTKNAEGRSNSSEEFLHLCAEVETLMRASAAALLNGRVDRVARLIMAQLAHQHGLRRA